MSEDTEESTAFLRQRRDLFVISVILLLIPIAKIKIASNVSMAQLGMSMHIVKPEVITYALWALWAYWYLRYFQAYRAFGKSFLADKYNSEISSYLYHVFTNLANKEKIKLSNDDKYRKGIGDWNYSFEKQRYSLFKCEYDCKFYANYYGEVIVVNTPLVYKGFRYNFTQIKTLLKCCLKNIEVTEYLFPFLFGLSPAIYLLISKIESLF